MFSVHHVTCIVGYPERFTELKYINNVFSSPCHMHCWLSRTFYRTQISLLEKSGETVPLRPLVIKRDVTLATTATIWSSKSENKKLIKNPLSSHKRSLFMSYLVCRSRELMRLNSSENAIYDTRLKDYWTLEIQDKEKWLRWIWLQVC